jgi:hypothetical protein
LKYAKTALLALGVSFAALPARPSTLQLSIEHHIAVASIGGKQAVLRTVFTDEPIIANVLLDVYALSQMPSTSVHLSDLQKLTRKDWWQHLQWDIRTPAGAPVAAHPRLRSSSVRERGPNVRNAADRDASVPCTSYRAAFDFGRLAPGNYTIRVAINGLDAPPFPFAVRSGSEPEVRDVYLQEKARNSRDWAEFKALELERVRLDPTKAAAFVELAQRSLEFGTLAETTDYFDRATKAMEQNIKEWAKVNPLDTKKQVPAVENTVTQMRALQRVLPEYFANRSQWRVSLDPATSHYVIIARDNGRVVRRIE